jgi:catechol 2,3-dioxygenase-like lactoylglutathione lyase family enzyme
MKRTSLVEGIDHIALAVRDVTASAQWYQDVLGLERRYQDVWGDYPAVVGAGTTALALFPVETAAPLPSPGRNVLTMRHVAFRADAANFARCQLELTQKQIAFEFQDHGISHSIYFHDPDGHQIEITTYDL